MISLVDGLYVIAEVECYRTIDYTCAFNMFDFSLKFRGMLLLPSNGCLSGVWIKLLLILLLTLVPWCLVLCVIVML